MASSLPDDGGERWLDFSLMATAAGGAAAAVAGRMIILCILLAKAGNANILHPLLYGFQCTLLDVTIH